MTWAAKGKRVEKGSEQKAVFFFFLVLFASAFLMAGRLLAPFFAIIVLGFVTTGIFMPLYRIMAGRLPPALSSILTCMVIFCVVLVPVIAVVSIISKEAYDLYVMGKNAVLSNQLQALLEQNRILDLLNQAISRLGFEFVLTGEVLIQPISELGRLVGFSLFQQASFIASNAFKVVFYFCLILVVVFYLFMDGERLIGFIYALSPLPRAHNERLFEKFREMAGAILVGNGLGGIIQGIGGGLLFFGMGLNSSFLWGVIMGFLAFLPIVGIGVVLVPTGVFLMLKGRMGAGIAMVISYGVLSWAVEYWLKPKLVGEQVKMHPLIIFFSILGGLRLYGVLGIIYGPLIVTLLMTLIEIYFASFQIFVVPEEASEEIDTAGTIHE